MTTGNEYNIPSSITCMRLLHEIAVLRIKTAKLLILLALEGEDCLFKYKEGKREFVTVFTNYVLFY